MATSQITHQMVASMSASILEEEMPFIGGANMNYDKEFAKNVGGFNVGDSVRIKVPPVPKTFDGPTATASDLTDESVNLTLNIWKGINLVIEGKDMTLDIADFKEQILRPQLAVLGSVLEATAIAEATKLTNHWVGTAGTPPTTLATAGLARGMLQRELAPDVDRRMLVSTTVNNAMVDASRLVFNPNADISKQYREGYIGRALQADWFETQNLYRMTTGTQASFTVNGASQTGSSLNIGTLTGGQTILKGTKFTLPSVFMTHPLTGAVTSQLMQFTVEADFTAAGATGTISIWPPIKPPSVANTNVSASPASGVTATLFAGASTAVTQNLMFQKNAFAVAVVPLRKLDAPVSYPLTLKSGIGCTYTSGADIANFNNITRIDALMAVSRPRGHACVMLE